MFKEMCSKVLFYFALAVVAVCRVQAADDPSAHDHWDDFAILIEELQQIVNNAQEVTFNLSRDLSTGLSSFGGNTTQDALGRVRSGYDILSRQLSDLQILADAFGVPQCLQARQEELKVISDDLEYGITNCIRRLQTEGGAIITNISAYVYGAQEQVTLLRIEVEQNCLEPSDDPEQIQCILDIVGRVQTAKDALPTMMLDEAIRVTVLMKTYEENIVQCGSERSGLIYTEGNRIVLEVERCIVTSGSKKGILEKIIPLTKKSVPT